MQPRDFASVVIGSEIYSAKSMQGRDERKPESERRQNFNAPAGARAGHYLLNGHV